MANALNGEIINAQCCNVFVNAISMCAWASAAAWVPGIGTEAFNNIHAMTTDHMRYVCACL